MCLTFDKELSIYYKKALKEYKDYKLILFKDLCMTDDFEYITPYRKHKWNFNRMRCNTKEYKINHGDNISEGYFHFHTAPNYINPTHDVAVYAIDPKNVIFGDARDAVTKSVGKPLYITGGMNITGGMDFNPNIEYCEHTHVLFLRNKVTITKVLHGYVNTIYLCNNKTVKLLRDTYRKINRLLRF
jgi:hypothetical protein